MMLLGALSALLIAALLAAASCAWLLAGQALWRRRRSQRASLDAQAALRRHPASRVMPDRSGQCPPAPEGIWSHPPNPAGPDDDPDFIRALERLIRGGGPDQPG
jgi:hypothetical protein